jgi:hypothetical protein
MKKKTAFSKLSITKQRIAIAEDALKHIENKILTPATMQLVVHDSISSIRNDKSKDLKTIFTDMKSCEVCARGGLFVALILKDNKMKLGDLINRGGDAVNERLSDVFTLEQIDLMENAFEGFDDDDTASFKFYKKYKTAKGRLIAILKNIIKNKGIFKP